MAHYFENFPYVNYKFGDLSNSTQYQNLGTYLDLIDQVKDAASFYEYYDLRNGDRADQVSQKLYGRPDYYWTFYLLNDSLRLQGFPLSYSDLVDKVKKDYPNTTINTRSNINSTFKVGSVITGNSSGTKAKILRKRLDYGQMIVGKISSDRDFALTTNVVGLVELELTTDGEIFTEFSDWQILLGGDVSPTTPTVTEGGEGHTHVTFDFGESNANTEYIFKTKVINTETTLSFLDGELITTTEDGVIRTAIVDTYELEYLATHHFEDESGDYVDVTPNAPFVQRVTLELEVDGSTSEQVQASNVNSITISDTNDYTTDLSMVVLKNSIANGYYGQKGNLLKAVVKTNQTIVDYEDGISLSEFMDTLLNELPEDSDIEAFYTEIYDEVAAAVGLADLNSNSKYTITVHLFLPIDKQLDVILHKTLYTLNTYGVAYEYSVSTVDTFKSVYVEGNNPTTITPAATTALDSWGLVSNRLNDYIRTNLSTLSPALLTQVSYFDRYVSANNSIKQIKVIRPDTIESIIKAFFDELNKEISSEQNAEIVGSATGQSITTETKTSETFVATTPTTISGYY